MTTQPRKKISGGLSLIILLTLVHIHFLGDPCLVHGEHTAQSFEATLSCRAMSCLCFFHAYYAPVEITLSGTPGAFFQAEDPPRDRPIRLLAFDIFHPPRV